MVTVTDKSRAKLRTSQGDLVLEFLVEKAPRTVKNFVGLAHKGFYDGLTFHRIVKDFMIQGGCTKGDGTGKPEYTIRPEFNDTPHIKGTVSMARNNDPHSAFSQFFICHGEPRYLDSRYTAFARVVDGLDVLDKIAGVPTDIESRSGEKSIPRDPVYINGVDLTDIDFSDEREAAPATATAEPASDDASDDASEGASEGADDSEDGAAAEKKPRRGRRGGRGRRPRGGAGEGEAEAPSESAGSSDGSSDTASGSQSADESRSADSNDEVSEPKPKPKARSRAKPKADAKAADTSEDKAEAAESAGEEKPKKKATRRRRAAPKASGDSKGEE